MRYFLAVFCGGLLVAAETVTLRADIYPPFNAIPGSEKPGSMVVIAHKVFGAAGYTVDYQVMPWSRTLDEVEAGRIDGAIGTSKGESDTLAFPDEAQGFWGPVFVTPAASTWTYAGLDSLKGLSIGTIPDYDYGQDLQGNSFMEWLATNPQKIQSLKGDKPTELALGMLAKKRLDLFIEDWSVIQAAAGGAKIELAHLRQAGQAGAGFPLSIAFSPTDRGRKLAKILSDGTAALRASGELATILTAYGQTDWKK
jgi:polar amino acid transport system substrate-binding protein